MEVSKEGPLRVAVWTVRLRKVVYLGESSDSFFLVGAAVDFQGVAVQAVAAIVVDSRFDPRVSPFLFPTGAREGIVFEVGVVDLVDWRRLC